MESMQFLQHNINQSEKGTEVENRRWNRTEP